MSTIVKSVYDALKSQVSTTLGATWSELSYLFNVEQNDRKEARKGFGVIPGAAVNNPSILKTYTLDQTFEIILTQTNTNELKDDDKINALLDDLYNQASEIFKDTLNTQLGIPTIVFTVSDPNMNEPEFTENYIVLRIQVTVKWRESLV